MRPGTRRRSIDLSTRPRDSAARATAQQGLYWIVLKIAQRCNLNCSYCYVYNRGDTSWKDRPATISNEVIEKLGERIKEQCSKYGLDEFVVEFHGGEPLLVGKERLQTLVDLLRRHSQPVRLKLLLQTNGLLLNEEWLDVFLRNKIGVGISLDGPAELADRYRTFHDGQGSTQALLDIINGLRRTSPLFDQLGIGYLCVMNPSVDGGQLVRWFVNTGFRSFDFLWPHGNYVNPPDNWTGAKPYERFLLEAFDEWYAMGKDAPQIRLFEVMMLGLLGLKPKLDALGGDLTKLCVIESDGAIGISDVVRFIGGEFARDALNIFDHPLDFHSSYYDLTELQRPCTTCTECPFLASCGGGYLQDRFDGRTFSNPSIYCDALYGLSERMMTVFRQDLPASVWC